MQDGLVDPGLMRAMEKVLKFKLKRNSRILHALEQPFFLNVGVGKNNNKIFMLRGMGSLKSLDFFCDMRGGSYVQTLHWTISCWIRTFTITKACRDLYPGFVFFENITTHQSDDSRIQYAPAYAQGGLFA